MIHMNHYHNRIILAMENKQMAIILTIPTTLSTSLPLVAATTMKRAMIAQMRIVTALEIPQKYVTDI
jgi:hypothetical protein